MEASPVNKNKYCIVIPCYNHEDFIGTMLQNLDKYRIHCLVVDDGSPPEATDKIAEAVKSFPWAEHHRRKENGGKGKAVFDGFELAAEKGFTHVIQIDADCQHNVGDIPKFIELAEEYPDALIAGQPVYDKTIPLSRKAGRWINHFWVMVELLSFKHIDAMCGFRLYPLAEQQGIERKSIGERMDFDVEILVRSIWKGVKIKTLKTKVTYPENSVSNFHYLKSNYQISVMHTRLFFGMLRRLPVIIGRKFKS